MILSPLTCSQYLEHILTFAFEKMQLVECNHVCRVGRQTHLQFEVSVVHKFWTSNDVFVVAWKLKVRVIWGNSLTWECSFKILVTGFSLFLCRVGGVRLNRWEGFSSIFCNCCFVCLWEKAWLFCSSDYVVLSLYRVGLMRWRRLFPLETVQFLMRSFI